MKKKHAMVIIYDEKGNVEQELSLDNILFAGMEDVRNGRIVSGVGGMFNVATVPELLIHCTGTGVQSTLDRIVMDGKEQILIDDKSEIYQMFKRGFEVGFDTGYEDVERRLDKSTIGKIKRTIRERTGKFH